MALKHICYQTIWTVSIRSQSVELTSSRKSLLRNSILSYVALNSASLWANTPHVSRSYRQLQSCGLIFGHLQWPCCLCWDMTEYLRLIRSHYQTVTSWLLPWCLLILQRQSSCWVGYSCSSYHSTVTSELQPSQNSLTLVKLVLRYHTPHKWNSVNQVLYLSTLNVNCNVSFYFFFIIVKTANHDLHWDVLKRALCSFAVEIHTLNFDFCNISEVMIQI